MQENFVFSFRSFPLGTATPRSSCFDFQCAAAEAASCKRGPKLEPKTEEGTPEG
jgi:hypothetical protein